MAAIVHLERRDMRLGLWVAACLLFPTVIGLIVGRQIGAPVLSVAVGVLVGVLTAAVIVTRSVLARYEDLAPREQEPTGEEP